MNWALVVNGVVENVVIADAEWIAAQNGDWVQSPDENPACIGYGYDPETGFEQPPPFVPNTPAV